MLIKCIDHKKETILDLSFAFSIAVVLIYVRDPDFLSYPRIWAEEGSIYLRYALEHNFLKSLTKAHLGYFSFFSNVTTALVARIIDLRYAAHVTTFASLAVQLLTIAAILTADGRILEGRTSKYLVSLALILFSSAEIWLNTINMQFWLATGTFFILNANRISLFHVLYLTFAFLSGAVSLFFAPFFFLRYIREGREPRAAIVCATSAIALAIQLISLQASIHQAAGARFNLDHIRNIRHAIFPTVVYPPFDFYNYVPGAIEKGIAVFLFICFVCAFLYWLKTNSLNYTLYVFLPVVTYSVLVILTSLHMAGGSRYSFPITCAIFALIVSMSRCWIKSRYWFLLPSALLLLRSFAFFNTDHFYNREWPNWQEQLERRDPSRPFEVLIFPQWEGASWRFTIPPSAPQSP